MINHIDSTQFHPVERVLTNQIQFICCVLITEDL